MGVSYAKLWKILVDRSMTKTDLRVLAGISTVSLAKLSKGKDVSLTTLEKVCHALNCDFSDIMGREDAG